MSGLVKRFRKDSGIRYLAVGLVHDVTPKDFRGEVEAVFQFVQNNIRYTQDINEVETIQWPEHTLETASGDCDDMSTLLATLLESIGHPCRFCAVSFEVPGEYDHVLVQTKIGNVWVPLDPTEPNPMGWQPPDILDYLIQFI